MLNKDEQAFLGLHMIFCVAIALLLCAFGVIHSPFPFMLGYATTTIIMMKLGLVGND